MRIYLVFPVIVAVILAGLIFARDVIHDPKTSHDHDIAFLVDVHLGNSDLMAKSAELESQVAARIASDMKKVGARVIDQQQFQTLLFGDFKERYEARSRIWIEDQYLKHLNAREIKAIAEYARSDEGRDLLDMTQPIEQKSPENVAAFFDGPGRPIADIIPELKAAAEAFLQEQHLLMTEYLSLGRVADITEMPHVVAFEDESMRAVAVEKMRALDNGVDYQSAFQPN